jgi:hypothetical protein
MDGPTAICQSRVMLSRREVCTALGGAAAVLLPGQPASAQTPPAGPLVALLAPVRVYDSRVDDILPGRRKLQSGDTVVVTVSPAYQGQAAAVFVNVTVTQTEGAGYLVVFAADFSGERPIPPTSNINWSTTGQTVANFALTAVGAENGVFVHCDGGGRTHVVVDVYGYVAFTG